MKFQDIIMVTLCCYSSIYIMLQLFTMVQPLYTTALLVCYCGIIIVYHDVT